jgi:type I restriction enzyme, R subunit
LSDLRKFIFFNVANFLEDICTKYILPALVRSGWDITKQVREQVYFTDGWIYVQGNQTRRGKAKKADYILLD